MKPSSDSDSDNDCAIFIKNLDDNTTMVFNPNQDTDYTQIQHKRTEAVWASYWSEVKQLEEELWEAVQSNNTNKLKQIFDKDAEYPVEINAESLDRWTALHYACFEGFPETTRLLIEKGANVDAKTSINRCALHLACIKGYDRIVQILLEYGCDPDQQDDDLCTPLHYAAMYGFDKVVKVLLCAEKKPNLKIKNYLNITAADCSLDTKTFQLFKEQSEDSYGRILVGDTIRRTSRADYVESLIQIGKKMSEEEKHPPLNFKKVKSAEVKVEQPKKFSKIMQLRIKDIEEKLGPRSFEILGLLGKGSFGSVYLVKKKEGKEEQFAMKVIEKKKVFENNLTKYIFSERNILTLMDNPFIVKIFGAFQTKQKLFLIIEYCEGGDLENKILREKRVEESVVKIYAAEVLLALESMHKREIIFRDLKPANVVLDSEGHAKVTDFGLSKQTKEFSKSFCGSIAYMAPEMLFKKRHGFTLDWYLFGVLIYELLDGLPPYYCLNRDKLFENIKHAKLQLPKGISLECADMLRKLLERDPSKRLGAGSDAKEIKEHPWFSDINWDDVMNRKLKPPAIRKKQRVNKQVDFDAGEQEEHNKLEGWSFINQK